MAEFDKAAKGLLPICIKGLLEFLGYGKVRRLELGQPEAIALGQSPDGLVHAYYYSAADASGQPTRAAGG